MCMTIQVRKSTEETGKCQEHKDKSSCDLLTVQMTFLSAAPLCSLLDQLCVESAS